MSRGTAACHCAFGRPPSDQGALSTEGPMTKEAHYCEPAQASSAVGSGSFMMTRRKR
jgi:hypothetical protein